MKLFDNFLGILFLTAAFQGLLLGTILIFFKKGNRIPNKFIGLLAILFSTYLVYSVAYWSGWYEKYIHISLVCTNFSFLYGPLLYLYIQSLENGSLKERQWTHFLPFIISTTLFLPFYFKDGTAKAYALYNETYLFLQSPFTYILGVLRILSLVAYSLMVLKHLLREGSKLNKFATEPEINKQKWERKLTFFFSIFTVSYLITASLYYAGWLTPAFDYSLLLIMGACIYLVAYQGFSQPEIFRQISQRSKYQTTTLNDSFIQRNKQRILSLLEIEKPYLKSDLKVQEMATMLQLSSHQLSQIINSEFGQNFSDFLNSYRIDEAKRRLVDPKSKNDKILKIALECGFNNKVSFSNAFRKFTDMSPTEYKLTAGDTPSIEMET